MQNDKNFTPGKFNIGILWTKWGKMTKILGKHDNFDSDAWTMVK